VEKETARLRRVADDMKREQGLAQAKAKPHVNGDAQESSAVGDALLDSPHESWHTVPDLKPALPLQFVRRVLSVILAEGAVYPVRIVKYLLERKAVSQFAIDGGFTNALLAKGDWKSIELAMSASTVPDIPEPEIVRLLQMVAARSRSNTENAMQVDEGHRPPGLSSFLSLCVAYPSSSAPLRHAIKEHLSQPEDQLAVLAILDGWIANWSGKTIGVGFESLVTIKPDGTASRAKPSRTTKKRAEGGQRLESALTFLQTLLDATSLSFLQYAPAHPILRRVAEHLEPEIDVQVGIEQLRGPLEPFVRMQAKAQQRATEKHDEAWKRRQREERQAQNLAVGAYQIEHLVF